MPKVYNKKHKGISKDAVYVGRPTKWGNPFIIGKDGTREDVVKLYREYITTTKGLDPSTLRGKDLVCWCAPEACHADVLLEIANETN